MTKIIGVDAAKLAGLQIDHLQKLRNGQRTVEQFEWYLNLPDAEMARLAVPQRPAKRLNLKKLLAWIEKNELASKLPGGLMGQIAEQEKPYQKFYGPGFCIDLKKIFVGESRLPAIQAGLEAGCLNYALIKAVPVDPSEAEVRMTEAEFFFERLMKPLKNDGFKIWAETGTARWTNLTLKELLERCNPAEPEEFDVEAFKKDWMAEGKRVIAKKGPAPKIQSGAVEIIFTRNLVNIPYDQTIVNKDGEIVELDDRSYVPAIAKKVRVLSHAEGIVLAAQLYAKNKSYLAPSTWEWRRDVIAHRDKGVSTPCSIASAGSNDREFLLDSGSASVSGAGGRLRLAL